MQTKKVLWLMSICACSVAPVLSCHAQQQPAVTEFIQQIERESCADQGAWLTPYNISPSQCGSVMHGIVGPCVTRAVSSKSLPLQTEGELKEVSQVIYDCMKQTFMSQYGGAANAAAGTK